MTKRRMTAKAKLDVEESEEEIKRLQKEIADLQAELKREADDIAEQWDAMLEDIDTYEVKPRRTDVDVMMTSVVWLPYWEITYEARGRRVSDRIPAWQMV